MSRRFGTMGMYLAYCVGSSGTTPTTGYTQIPEVKSIPSFNPSPNTIDSTTLLETEYMTYVEGLKDLGGALEFGANLTADLITAWAACNTAHDGMADSGAMWFAVVHPGLGKAVFFEGDPSPLGLNEASVNAIFETTLYITPNSAPTWGDAPTLAS